jgi:hypothetical protein
MSVSEGTLHAGDAVSVPPRQISHRTSIPELTNRATLTVVEGQRERTMEPPRAIANIEAKLVCSRLSHGSPGIRPGCVDLVAEVATYLKTGDVNRPTGAGTEHRARYEH